MRVLLASAWALTRTRTIRHFVLVSVVLAAGPFACRSVPGRSAWLNQMPFFDDRVVATEGVGSDEKQPGGSRSPWQGGGVSIKDQPLGMISVQEIFVDSSQSIFVAVLLVRHRTYDLGPVMPSYGIAELGEFARGDLEYREPLWTVNCNETGKVVDLIVDLPKLQPSQVDQPR